jgi:hypothetical protein
MNTRVAVLILNAALSAAFAQTPPAPTADGLIGVNRQFKDWLKSKDVKFTDVEVPDVAHVWPLGRQNLTELAPLLFLPKGK